MFYFAAASYCETGGIDISQVAGDLYDNTPLCVANDCSDTIGNIDLLNMASMLYFENEDGDHYLYPCSNTTIYELYPTGVNEPAVQIGYHVDASDTTYDTYHYYNYFASTSLTHVDGDNVLDITFQCNPEEESTVAISEVYFEQIDGDTIVDVVIEHKDFCFDEPSRSCTQDSDCTPYVCETSGKCTSNICTDTALCSPWPHTPLNLGAPPAPTPSPTASPTP